MGIAGCAWGCTMTRGLAAGALLFGVGWAVSGTRPGTALAQIGEGRLAGVLTFAGILLGASLQLWQKDRLVRRAEPPVSGAEAPTAAR